jgi:uncharacterized damage-inducible protein DinB
MAMREHLLELFNFNDWANRRILDVVLTIEQPDEGFRLFSHMIQAQNRWMNRITREVPDSTLSWNVPAFDPKEILNKWGESIGKWSAFLRSPDSADLDRIITYQAPDGKQYSSSLTTIMLQLNFHSIHHRAQIMAWLRSKGVAPPPSDYIILKRLQSTRS